MSHDYPLLLRPVRPVVEFGEPAPGIPGNCVDDDAMRRINGYVGDMERLADDYECEITIINGGECQ